MKKRYLILLILIAMTIGICLTVYRSYALWIVTHEGQENSISIGCFSVSFQESQNNTKINISNSYPVSDAKALSDAPYYSFTIKNNCTVDSKYQVTLNTVSTNTLNKNKIKYALYKSTDTKPTTGINLGTITNLNTDTASIDLVNLDESLILTTGTLTGRSDEETDDGESTTYNLYLWMDENDTNADANKTFESAIYVTSVATKIHPASGEGTLAKLKELNPSLVVGTSMNVNSGVCPVVDARGNIIITAKEDSASLLCSAPDEYGTSYYFRGNVDNNWVKFADSYWKIMRINGDGSIRMIYAGNATTIDALDSATKTNVLRNGYNDSTSKYSQIGVSSFNSLDNHNAYVGYMYGNNTLSYTGTTDLEKYNETHSSVGGVSTSSTIKGDGINASSGTLDYWYKMNIVENNLQPYIADNLFCNDRSISSGLGYGDENTSYRWSSTPWNNTDKTYPTFKCAQQQDRFTVNDTTNGNGALSYPVALVTADEVVASGLWSSAAQNNYLYTGNKFWTMSPSTWLTLVSNSSNSCMYNPTTGEETCESGEQTTSSGVAMVVFGSSYSTDFASASYGIRPVISLASTATFTSGDGTSTNPFVVRVN